MDWAEKFATIVDLLAAVILIPTASYGLVTGYGIGHPAAGWGMIVIGVIAGYMGIRDLRKWRRALR